MDKTCLFKPAKIKKPNSKLAKKNQNKLDEELDKKLKDTFPASDATAKY